MVGPKPTASPAASSSAEGTRPINVNDSIAQESGQCQERGHPPTSFQRGTIPQGDGLTTSSLKTMYHRPKQKATGRSPRNPVWKKRAKLILDNMLSPRLHRHDRRTGGSPPMRGRERKQRRWKGRETISPPSFLQKFFTRGYLLTRDPRASF